MFFESKTLKTFILDRFLSENTIECINTKMNTKMNTKTNTNMNTKMNMKINTKMNTNMNTKMNTKINTKFVISFVSSIVSSLKRFGGDGCPFQKKTKTNMLNTETKTKMPPFSKRIRT